MSKTASLIGLPAILSGIHWNQLRRAKWRLILIFLLAEVVYYTLINQVFIPIGILSHLQGLAGSLVNATLVVNLVGFIIIIIGILILWGRLRKEDLGFRFNLLPQAGMILVGVWLISQIIGLIISLATEGTVSLDNYWSQYGTLMMLGALIGQLFGNSLLEETANRGFLLPQLLLKINFGWLKNHR